MLTVRNGKTVSVPRKHLRRKPRKPSEPRPPGPLTATQRQVLDYLESFFLEHWQMPSLREMSAQFAWTSPTAAVSHLSALAKKGFIDRQLGTYRGIRLTGCNLEIRRPAPPKQEAP